MINYTIEHLLGIFLLLFPLWVYFAVVVIRGFLGIMERFFEDETDKNVFHHHLHYSDKSKQFAPPRKNL